MQTGLWKFKIDFCYHFLSSSISKTSKFMHWIEEYIVEKILRRTWPFLWFRWFLYSYCHFGQPIDSKLIEALECFIVLQVELPAQEKCYIFDWASNRYNPQTMMWLSHGILDYFYCSGYERFRKACNKYRNIVMNQFQTSEYVNITLGTLRLSYYRFLNL